MNDNQEKQSFDEKPNGSEPLTKKVAKFSAFIYLGLAIAVVVVATVGIFSISYDYEASIPSVSFPDITFDQSQATSKLPEVSKPEAPVGNEESDVDAEISEPEQKIMFYRPINGGAIIKKHSLDTLVFSETMGDYRVHTGVDLKAELGTDVICFADGTVAAITEDYFDGVTVTVAHGEEMVSYYMNLDPVLAENIAVGSEVLAGQIIGKVGNTSRLESAQEPHLHFELKINGEYVDPETELPE